MRFAAGILLLLGCLALAWSAPDPEVCKHITRDPQTNSEIIYNQLHLIRFVNSSSYCFYCFSKLNFFFFIKKIFFLKKNYVAH